MAVKTFKGGWSDQVFEEHKSALVKLLKAHNFEQKGDWEVYRYNPPWTIPAFKTNEVAIEVDMKK